MRLEKERTYLAPAGKHKARIEDVQMVSSERNGERKEGIKLIFEITSISHYSRTYMARKLYWQADSKTLLKDLEELLGEDIKQVISAEGDILEANLGILIHRECEIQINHVHKPTHSTPFCKVTILANAEPTIKSGV